jgi:hypothetical protein
MVVHPDMNIALDYAVNVLKVKHVIVVDIMVAVALKQLWEST